MKFTRQLAGFAPALCVLTASAVHAADGTWTSTTGTPLNWTDSTKWSGGVIADGAGFTANFTSNIGANTTVALNGTNRTIGNIVFNDSGATADNAWIISGNTLNLDNTGGTGVPTITTTSDATISSLLTGTAGFTKNGAGTLTLNNAATNTITGGITVNEGRLILDIVSHSTNIPVVSQLNTLTLGGGTVEIKGKTGVTASQGFAGVVLNAGSSTVHANQNGSSTTAFNTLNGITRNVGGTVNFTTSGAGFSMTTAVNTNGIIGGYATSGGTTWAVGSAAGANTNVTALATYTTNGTLTNASNNIDVTSTTLNATGNAANTLRFNTAGAHTLNLASGTTILTSGGILVTATVGNAATLITGGTSLAGAAGQDLIVHQHNTANTLTIESNIVDNTSATGLTKSGAGTLIVSGNNNYTGLTTVNTGTLRVNGANTGTGAVNVSGAGRLEGTGSIASAVNVSGVLAPGASIESLRTGSVTLNNGATLAVEIQDVSASGADLLGVDGDLSLNGQVTLDLTKIGSGAWAHTNKITIASYTGTWNGGLFTFGGNTLADGAEFTFDNTQWAIDYNDTIEGNNFASDSTGNYVTMTVVPEPSVALLGGLGVLALLRRRRM